MNYQRVIPRDLFNEAKLLKCLGRFSLFIHDDKFNLESGYLVMELHEEEKGFTIIQDMNGDISCENLHVLFNGDSGEHYLNLRTLLNSKENYPLWCYVETENDEIDVQVFNDDGSINQGFKEVLERINNLDVR